MLVAIFCKKLNEFLWSMCKCKTEIRTSLAYLTHSLVKSSVTISYGHLDGITLGYSAIGKQNLTKHFLFLLHFSLDRNNGMVFGGRTSRVSGRKCERDEQQQRGNLEGHL